jgi:hypothetical protein
MPDSGGNMRNGDQITLSNADGYKTNKVGKNGTVFVGREFAGETVTVAFRVEQDEETEKIEADD